MAVAVATLLTVPQALAQNSYDIMVEEGGKPLKRSPKPIETDSAQKPKQPRSAPRGSGYVPSMNLPRSEPARVPPNSPGVYTPPPINSFGDRVRSCIHSYPLNAGVGNNPTDQSMYIRQCAN